MKSAVVLSDRERTKLKEVSSLVNRLAKLTLSLSGKRRAAKRRKKAKAAAVVAKPKAKKKSSKKYDPSAIPTE